MKQPSLCCEIDKAFRLATAPLRKLPDFVIAGAPKCATSSLFDALCCHPDVRRGGMKEPTNFIHYPGSVLRSKMHQPFFWQARVSGEGSVEYFAHPEAPANVADVLPAARVLFVLREPVARAWSDFRMFVRSGHETQSFEERVEAAVRWLSDPSASDLCEAANRLVFNPLRYVRCGMYAAVLENWWRSFPREQTLVVFSEELVAEPAHGMEKICTFLGLRPFRLDELPKARVAEKGANPSPRAVDLLKTFYERENQRLSELLGRTLPW